MQLRVLYHGNCFDGCSSAGLFARFYRERMASRHGDVGPVDVAYRPLEHKGAGPAIAPEWFDGDQNACVDFRYSQDARLHWWFDHHVSAFQQPGDEAHFRADASGQKFYDPAARSCARFLARTVAERFGFDTAPVAELIEWAEIIDGALFPDPRMPVELKEPALRLMTWIENNKTPALANRFIEDLASRPLADIVADNYVAEPLAVLLEQHQKNIEIVREGARLEKGVIVSDLADSGVTTFNKFIGYYLFPEARYSVTVSAGARAKVSVGCNPWSPVPRAHEINKICERYGGGGHPVVGAVSVPKGELARAREIAGEIVAELQS
jgi:hypothetical protein